MKYIKRFSAHTDYEEYIKSGVTPNISACDNDKWATFHYINSGVTQTKNEPLCFTTLESGNTQFNVYLSGVSSTSISLMYSYDGQIWSNYTIDSAILLNDSDKKKVFIKGDNNGFNTLTSVIHFMCNKSCSCHGNVMSLLGEHVTEIPTSYCFYKLFEGANITTPPELPSTTLKPYCYREMFRECKKLIKAPDLLAMYLEDGCYYNMFYLCTKLSEPPYALPALELKTNCYYGMFSECYSIRTAPIISAEVTAPSCCRYMFKGCHSLIVGPILHSEVVAESGYSGMFDSCYFLPSIAIYAQTLDGDNCLTNFLSNVSVKYGTVLCYSGMTSQIQESGVPSDWVIKETAYI